MIITDLALADAFRAEQLDFCAELRRETDYNPARFEQQVRARDGEGAVKFSRDLIVRGPLEGSLGYQHMLRIGRARQTVEFQALAPRWRPLFDRAVRDAALFRLRYTGVEHLVPRAWIEEDW